MQHDGKEVRDLEWLLAKQRILDFLDAARLVTARQRAQWLGKEPFDFAYLCTIYDPSSELSASSKLHDPKGEAARLEVKYYVHYQDVMTLDAFAECLEEMRAYS